jgi:endonuclease/exonuclease/phosphatase family metal-dependent hydrolase
MMRMTCKRRVLVACSLLALAAISPLSPARADDVAPLRVRVLSYNIHHGKGTEGRLDLERIARVIRSVEPDLVALQEVDHNTERTGKVDQPAELARLTGMQVVFGSNLALQGGGYGNAVLSRWPIKRHENHLLPNTGGEQRGVLLAHIELPGGARLIFLATHLDHRRPDVERVASVETINRLIANRDPAPALLAGDLNDVAGSRPLDVLLGSWHMANDQPLLTSPATAPRRQIDYILFRPTARWQIVEARVLDEPVASDHRPLLAVLELKAE